MDTPNDYGRINIAMTSTVQSIKDEDVFVSAKFISSGVEIQTHDDGSGPLWILRDSMCVLGIVRASSWYDAWEIAEDELFPEADECTEKLRKEYGPTMADAMDNEMFQENYGFRPSGPNARDTHRHGVYQKDLNGESLDRLTNQLADDLGIQIEIETDVTGEDFE